jgi:hypothetical protein
LLVAPAELPAGCYYCLTEAVVLQVGVARGSGVAGVCIGCLFADTTGSLIAAQTMYTAVAAMKQCTTAAVLVAGSTKVCLHASVLLPQFGVSGPLCHLFPVTLFSVPDCDERPVMHGLHHREMPPLTSCVSLPFCVVSNTGASELCAAHQPADHGQPNQDPGHPLPGAPERRQEPAAPVVLLFPKQALAAYHICRGRAGAARQQQQQGGACARPWAGHTPCSSSSSSSWWEGQQRPARYGSGSSSCRHGHSGCCHQSESAAGASRQTHGAAAGGNADAQQPAAPVWDICRHTHRHS